MVRDIFDQARDLECSHAYISYPVAFKLQVAAQMQGRKMNVAKNSFILSFEPQ